MKKVTIGACLLMIISLASGLAQETQPTPPAAKKECQKSECAKTECPKTQAKAKANCEKAQCDKEKCAKAACDKAKCDKAVAAKATTVAKKSDCPKCKDGKCDKEKCAKANCEKTKCDSSKDAKAVATKAGTIAKADTPKAKCACTKCDCPKGKCASGKCEKCNAANKVATATAKCTKCPDGKCKCDKSQGACTQCHQGTSRTAAMQATQKSAAKDAKNEALIARKKAFAKMKKLHALEDNQAKARAIELLLKDGKVEWLDPNLKIEVPDVELLRLRNWQDLQGHPEIHSFPATPAYQLGIIVNPENGKLVVTDLAKGSPAEKAGFKKGDQIIAVNRIRLNSLEALRSIVSAAGSQPLHVSVQRGDKTETINVTPQKSEASAQLPNKFLEQKNRLMALKATELKKKAVQVPTRPKNIKPQGQPAPSKLTRPSQPPRSSVRPSARPAGQAQPSRTDRRSVVLPPSGASRPTSPRPTPVQRDKNPNAEVERLLKELLKEVKELKQK